MPLLHPVKADPSTASQLVLARGMSPQQPGPQVPIRNIYMTPAFDWATPLTVKHRVFICLGSCILWDAVIPGCHPGTASLAGMTLPTVCYPQSHSFPITTRIPIANSSLPCPFLSLSHPSSHPSSIPTQPRSSELCLGGFKMPKPSSHTPAEMTGPHPGHSLTSCRARRGSCRSRRPGGTDGSRPSPPSRCCSRRG